MHKKAILVSGIGGDIGGNIIKCLAEGVLDWEIYGSDAREYSPGKRLAQKFFIAPLACDQKAYMDFITEIVEENNIRYIFPSSEAEIEFFDNNRAGLLKLGVTVMINEKTVLDKFTDKYHSARFLTENGIEAPETFLLKEYNGQLPFPLILKKRRGSGSNLVLIVENETELQFYKEKYAAEDLVVQEYLGDKDHEYTIGVYANDRNIFSIGFRRYLAKDAGVTIYAELVRDQEIEDTASRIARACHLRGLLNIQARKTRKGYVPFEINPRISGTSYVRHQFGFTDVLWWLLDKEGKDVVYVPKYTKGVAVRTISETFFDLDEELASL